MVVSGNVTDKSNILRCIILLACCSIGVSISDHNSMSEQTMSDGLQMQRIGVGDIGGGYTPRGKRSIFVICLQ